MKKRICKTCKKIFLPHGDFVAKKDGYIRKQIYCSKKCFQKDWAKNIRPRIKTKNHPTGEKNPAMNGQTKIISTKEIKMIG